MAELRRPFIPANDNRDRRAHGRALINSGVSLITDAREPGDVMERAGRKLVRRGLDLLEGRA